MTPRLVELGVDVDDDAAARADRVVVVGDARVPHDGAALGRHAADEAELLEQLERRVDGR